MQNDLNQADKKQIEGIHQCLQEILKAGDNKSSMDRLLAEMNSQQPFLHTVGKELYDSGLYNGSQMLAITTLLLLIHRVYSGKLPRAQTRIDQTMFDQAIEALKTQAPPDSPQAFETWLKDYPARWLYTQVHGKIFSEPAWPLQNLSDPHKSRILVQLRLVIDCYEMILLQSRSLRD
ncbi:MAG: hypothetical protein V4539_06610 [Bacteroidota bacterium]